MAGRRGARAFRAERDIRPKNGTIRLVVLDAAREGGDAFAMILEVAILNVRPGQSEAFQAAFQQAQTILARMPGCQRHELRRCLEDRDRYLLLVDWDCLESHTEGFRGSPEYQRWRALLHPFYDPFPVVEHYESVPGAST